MADFHTALFLANMLYGIEMNDEDFEEMGLIIYRMIGNKHYKLYHFIGKINPEDNTIELPCNCDEGSIVSVTYEWEDWNYTTDKHTMGDTQSSFIELYIEVQKHFNDPLYHQGRFVKYHREGGKLYLNELGGGPIHIVYKGEVLDENGLPDINDKEAMAIATWVAYANTYKEGLLTKNGTLIQLAADLKNKANVYIDLARTPIGVSQNDLDEILEVKTSWNRKTHRKSYKPLM